MTTRALPPSTIEQLQTDIRQIAEEVSRLVVENGAPYLWNRPTAFVHVVTSTNYAWPALRPEHVPHQTKLLGDLEHLNAVLKIVGRALAPGARHTVRGAVASLRALIERRETWCQSAQDATAGIAAQARAMTSAFDGLYDPRAGETVLVPDTNALFAAPHLERWRFPDISAFSIMLTPTVLADLDRHKIEHQNPELREKAQGLVRRLKSYARRGRLTDGVPLVHRKSTLYALAVEPRAEDMLTWLDPSNDYDRILASIFEIMRIRPRCSVLLITGDINLLNKAGFARVPVIEPPDAEEDDGSDPSGAAPST